MDSWTEDQVARLIEIVKGHKGTKTAAYELAAKELGRSPGACQGRYSATTKKRKPKKVVQTKAEWSVPRSGYLLQIVDANGNVNKSFLPGVKSVTVEQIKVITA